MSARDAAAPTRTDVMSPEDVISAAWQVAPLAGGFAAAVEDLDTRTGATRTRLLRLSADGTPLEGTPEAPSENPLELGTGAHASLALAALRLPALRRDEARLAAALAAVAPAGVLEVAADRRVLVALDGARDAWDGGGQRLHRLGLGARETPAAEPLDLGPLRLGARRRITGLALRAGWLYAMVADPEAGFDVFRAVAAAPAPDWEPLIARGAHRFALGAAVSAIGPGPDGGLLLGTAALAPGAAAVGDWSPEIVLLHPSGAWDLLVGRPRFTPDGLKRPPGPPPDLGPANAAVKAFARDARSGTTFALLQGFAGDPAGSGSGGRAAPDLLDYMGDLRLLASDDLAAWREVPLGWPRGLGAVTGLAVAGDRIVLGHERAGDQGPPVTALRLP
jgi:hypothetical protein